MKKITVIFAAFGFLILWLYLIKCALPYFYKQTFFSFTYTNIGIFFFACIFAPLWEELVFRHAPIQIAKKLNDRLKVNLIWPVVIISSYIFGWGHGSGPISLLIQGVGGLLLSYVYIKNNYSYWSSVAMHFLWNFSLLYVFPKFTAMYGIEIW